MSYFYARYGKRLFDVGAAALVLAVTGPMLVTVAICVRIALGKPVLFRQIRPGLKEEPFTLVKFRTMTEERGDDNNLCPDEVRITPIGRFLRRSSIDELPELWNVLRGDMSLVGPRPLLSEYLPYYTETERSRHSVRPGVTGLAQVAGRNTLDWDARLAMDVEYVNRVSILTDLKIIFATIPAVLLSRGIAPITTSSEGNLMHQRTHQAGEQIDE